MTTLAMNISDAQGWALIITTSVAAFGTIVGIIVSTVNSLRLGRTEKKVDAVKADVDGASSLARETLKITKERVVQLEESIRKSGQDVPEETKQTAQRDESPKHSEDNPAPASTEAIPIIEAPATVISKPSP